MIIFMTNAIRGMLNNANDNITGIQKELWQYANCPSVVRARSWDLKSAQFQIKSCEEQVSAITKLIDLVENERAEYYYLYENNQVLSIKTAEYPVLTPKTVDGKLVWDDTGVKIEVYEVQCFDSDDIKALVPSNKNPEMYGAVECRYNMLPYFKGLSFREGKSYVGFEGVEDLDPDSFYITCVNCKRIFALTKEHQEWYTIRGYSLPKRCSACREEKRIKEYEDDASTSFFAWD